MEYVYTIGKNIIVGKAKIIHIMKNRKKSKNETVQILNKQVSIIGEILITVFAAILCMKSNMPYDIVFDYLLILLMIMIMEYLIIYRTQEEIKAFHDWNVYFRKQYSYENKIKKWQNSSTIYALFGGAKTAIAIIIVVFAFVYYRLILRINSEMWIFFSGEEKEDKIALIVAVYALLITMLQIVGAYIGKKSFLLEFDQYPSIKKSIVWLWLSIIALVFFIVMYVNTNSEYYRFAGTIWILCIVFCIILMLWTVFKLYFEISEKNIIRDMYKLYWGEKINVTPSKIWFKGRMFEGLENFFSNYMKNSKKFAGEKIKIIEFGNVYEQGDRNNKIAEKKIGEVLTFYGIILIVCFAPIFMWMYPYKYSFVLFFIIFAQVVTPVGSLWIYLKRTGKVRFMNLFQVNQWGYYVGEENIVYIPAFCSSSRIYGKYLMNIKSIIAFFNLARNMKYEDLESSEVEYYYIDCMIENIRNKGQGFLKNVDKDAMAYAVIPIIICGCLVEKQKRKVRNEIQSLFEDMHMNKENQSFIEETSLCVLRDFVGNDKEYWKRESQYKKTIESFMKQKKRKKAKKVSN